MDEAEVAGLFGKWAAKAGLLSRITQDQCADLAQAFIAGFFYGQNPILRADLTRDGERAVAATSITCPRCEMTSHNADDVRAGYCGNCHDWTGTPTPVR